MAIPAMTGWRTTLKGSGTVTIGLIVLGLSSYIFLTISARVLGPNNFSLLATLWSLVYAIGGGAFAPLEQEFTRIISKSRSGLHEANLDGGPTLTVAGTLAILVPIVLFGLRTLIARQLFRGDIIYVDILIISVILQSGLYVLRGTIAGSRRYSYYAFQLGSEGLTRAIIAAIVATVGLNGNTWLVVSVPLASAISLIATIVFLWARRLEFFQQTWYFIRGAGTRSWRRGIAKAGRRISSLSISSLEAQGLANLGPVAVQLISREPAASGRLLASFIVVRLPLFFSSAIQASLLPELVSAVETNDETRFMGYVSRFLATLLLLAIASSAIVVVAGPSLVRILFGSAYSSGIAELLILGNSSVLLLGTTILQAALVALDRHAHTAFAWTVASIVFLGSLFIPIAAISRIEIALLGSSGIAFLAMGTLLLHQRNTHYAQ